jgi:hypothetical protein
LAQTAGGGLLLYRLQETYRALMFSDNDIRRNGLPLDAFRLIHDLCYIHNSSPAHESYRKRAQAILKSDVDTAKQHRAPLKRTAIGKSDRAKERASLTKECDSLTKQLIIYERGFFCERCGADGRNSPLHSAHIKSKAHYRRLRFEKQNLLLLCYKDHLEFAHKEPQDFILWIEEKWPGRLQQLRIMAATAAKVDLKQLVIVLRAEVRALGIEG